MPLTLQEAQALDQFIKQTVLLPRLIIDNASEVACQYLKDDPLLEHVYEKLRSDVVARRIEEKTANAYLNDKKFKKAVLVKDARPAYNQYVRQWVGVIIKESYPAQFEKLPADLFQ